MEVKFREYITRNGTTVFSGKDENSNEKLIEQVEKDEEVFHTAAAGSPFVNIKGKVKKGDIKESAIFCAFYSREWKQNKKEIILVHRFKGKDIYKEKGMKKGTFGIKKFKVIKITKKDIEKWLPQ